MRQAKKSRIAVVIPCFQVKNKIMPVLEKIGHEIQYIYLVDDACPEHTGRYVQSVSKDKRIKYIFHEGNQGVGAAVISGYKAAIADAADIVVKIDGDGQMNPELIREFIHPILHGACDYSKGNRFHDLTFLQSMPIIRLFGNSFLSLINKAVSGYWNIMDPTNGFTAIHISIIEMLPLDKIAKRYFFESDMLFWLSTVRAVVKDIPMKSVYANEISNLRIRQALIYFPFKYLKRLLQRIFYQYLLRDFNAGTVMILSGIPLFLFGFYTGILNWQESIRTGIPATSGTVMLAALPLLVGIQFIIVAIIYDISSVPETPVQKILKD